MMEYTETPTDRIGRTFVGFVLLPFVLVVGFVLVITLISGSIYASLIGR